MITGRRSGFTLIELLMVIAIIATLAALSLASVNKVLTRLSEVETRVEISQLDGAIASFMMDYGLQSPPPSYLYLREDNLYSLTNPVDVVTIKWLRTWLGNTFDFKVPVDWNGNGAIDAPYFLQGDQCLVLWTGGIPAYNNGSISMKGFGFSNRTPTLPTVQHHGPYMNFNSTRLTLRGHFPVYMDAWKNKYTQQPYAFFSSQGALNAYNGFGAINPTGGPRGDCGTSGANPYYQLAIGNPPFPMYLNGNRWQIISAGRDGVFGADIVSPYPGVQWNAVDGSFTKITINNNLGKPAGFDDQGNFSSTLLGIGQH